jgi:serine/threonine-protein kinase RsbW
MTEFSAWTWVTDTTLPSARGAGHRVLHELLHALERSGWNQEEIFGVHLAVEEALVNAIRHGNGSDHHKQVQVSCKVAPSRLIVEITDEGRGFNPDHVPDCTAEENLHRPGGRGIMLMRSYMSRVEYLDGGQRVVMEKRRA